MLDAPYRHRLSAAPLGTSAESSASSRPCRSLPPVICYSHDGRAQACSNESTAKSSLSLRDVSLLTTSRTYRSRDIAVSSTSAQPSPVPPPLPASVSKAPDLKCENGRTRRRRSFVSPHCFPDLRVFDHRGKRFEDGDALLLLSFGFALALLWLCTDPRSTHTRYVNALRETRAGRLLVPTPASSSFQRKQKTPAGVMPCPIRPRRTTRSSEKSQVTQEELVPPSPRRRQKRQVSHPRSATPRRFFRAKS